MIKRLIFLSLILILVVLPFSVKFNLHAQVRFPDVPSDHWAYEAITKLVEMGVVKGFPDGKFYPNNTVTRAQFATMVVLAKKLTLVSPATPTFNDVPTTHWAYKYVETAAKAGYVKGIGGGRFGPDLNIKREDLAVLLINTLGLQEEAAKFKEPLVLAQDGKQISSYAIGAVTLAYAPQYQLLNYHSAPGGFRVVDPKKAATRAECAYAIYQALNSPKKGGQIVIGMSQEPDTLSIVGTMAARSQVLGSVGWGDVHRADNWDIYPFLLEEIPTLENGLWKILPEEKMEITFKLRKGIKWSTGVEVTVDDYLFAHEVVMNDKVPLASRMPNSIVEKMEKIDNYTLKVTYKQLYHLANLGLWILPKHYLEPIYRESIDKFLKSDEFNRKVIGMGPYMIEEWRPGERIVLVPNPHFPFRPVMDKIIWRFIRDTNTLLATVLSGGVDAVAPVGLTFDQGLQLKKGEATSIYKTYIDPALVWEHIDFKTDHPWFADKRVRQAFLYAIDREKIVRNLFQGLQPVAHSWLPPKHYGYEPNIKKYEYNPEKAKQLLAEAGWKPGPDGILVNEKGEKFEFINATTAGNAIREQVQQIIQADLRKVGIVMKIVNKPSTVLFGEYTRRRKYEHTVMYAWVMSPTSYGTTLWHSRYIPSEENGWVGQNYPGWSHPRSDELLDLVEKELDAAKRAEYLREQQRIWVEEVPSIPLYFRADVSVAKKTLANWKPTSSLVPISWNSEEWYWKK